MVRFLSLLCLIATMPLINSCDVAQFGDYKPLYFTNEADLKTANEYINSLGYKTISEYTTKIDILDFPENKKITINETNKHLKEINFLTLITKIKHLLFFFTFTTLYFITITAFFTTNIDPTFIAFVAIPALCIFLIFSWIKTESNFKDTFLFPIEIKERRKEEKKTLKFKIAIHLLLFTLSLMPFAYSSYILNSYKNINYLYSKKLNYFDYLNPNNIYIMLGYNKDMPNIVGYLSHILYQNELKYNITAKYGKIPKNIKENYFEVKNDKIEINPKTVYEVDKSFIDEALKKDLASLFLNNKNPIRVCTNTP